MTPSPEEILKSIVKDEALVVKHTTWAWHIKTDFAALKMIGLVSVGTALELSFYFADSQSQSKAFYALNLDFTRVKSDWHLLQNFHLSNPYKNVLYFESPSSKNTSLVENDDYRKFWKNNLGLLHQHSIDKIPELLNFLDRERIISLEKNAEKLKDFYRRKYTKLNVCAGFGVILKIPNEDIDSKSKAGTLRQFLIDKINEGLSVIGENGNSFLIDLTKNTQINDDITGAGGIDKIAEEGDPGGFW